jgi:hypothetical protein
LAGRASDREALAEREQEAPGRGVARPSMASGRNRPR